MTEKYTPISCSIYDEYELAAVRRDKLELVLSDGRVIQSKLKTLETVDSVEYMILENDDRIRLDHIESRKVL